MVALRFVLVVAGAGGVLALGCSSRDEASSPDGLAARTPRTVTTEATPLVLGKIRLNDRRIDLARIELAREAALNGDATTVRRVLDRVVLTGHASMEEARLLREACKSMGDRICVDDIRARYPDA
jgi:hypothetical protein